MDKQDGHCLLANGCECEWIRQDRNNNNKHSTFSIDKINICYRFISIIFFFWGARCTENVLLREQSGWTAICREGVRNGGRWTSKWLIRQTWICYNVRNAFGKLLSGRYQSFLIVVIVSDVELCLVHIRCLDQ